MNGPFLSDGANHEASSLSIPNAIAFPSTARGKPHPTLIDDPTVLITLRSPTTAFHSPATAFHEQKIPLAITSHSESPHSEHLDHSAKDFSSPRSSQGVQPPAPTDHGPKSYRPHELCGLIAKSPNSSDHLRRIHVASAKYCKQRGEKRKEFISFIVVDSAVPGVSNHWVLDRNGRRAEVEQPHTPPRQRVFQSLIMKLPPVSLVRPYVCRTALRPGRFYISDCSEVEDANDESSCNYEIVEKLDFSQSSGEAFSLEYLLVLASSLASRLRFRHPKTMQFVDWYPKSMWDAMRAIYGYLQTENSTSLPSASTLTDLNNDFMGRVLRAYGKNLRDFRNEVILQQKEDKELADQRRSQEAAEIARNREQTHVQRKAAECLDKQSAELDSRRQELEREIERLMGRPKRDMSIQSIE